MSRSASRRKTRTARSRSPRRGTRSSGSVRRRSVRLEDEVDSEGSSSLEIASRGAGSESKKAASYALSSGLDSESG